MTPVTPRPMLVPTRSVAWLAVLLLFTGDLSLFLWHSKLVTSGPLLATLLTVVSLVAILTWLARSYVNAEALGRGRELPCSAVWAVVGCAVPGVNLLLPAHLGAALWRASLPSSRREAGDLVLGYLLVASTWALAVAVTVVTVLTPPETRSRLTSSQTPVVGTFGDVYSVPVVIEHREEVRGGLPGGATTICLSAASSLVASAYVLLVTRSQRLLAAEGAPIVAPTGSYPGGSRKGVLLAVMLAFAGAAILGVVLLVAAFSRL